MVANGRDPIDDTENHEKIETTDLLTLIGHNSSVNGSCLLEQVYEGFQHHSHEFVAVINDDQKVLGICSREEVGMLLGLRYGRELFARKQVSEHLSHRATLVTVGDRITSVLDQALARSEQVFFDDVVLVGRNGNYLGLIPMRTLILLQNRFLSETIKGINQQRLVIEERQRQMEEELVLASRLQQTMSQHESCLFPSGTQTSSLPYKLHYRYRPATQVGGDFFHAFPLPCGQVGILLCDVMGHGVRSALVTAMIRALAETHVRSAEVPGAFLTQLNRDLSLILQQADDQLFVTALYLVLDINHGLGRYAVAGHHDPLHFRKKECRIVPLTADQFAAGPPLGIVGDFTYGTSESRFANGDLFLLYTDGLFEVFSPDGEEYGQERLLSAMQELILQTVPIIFDEIIAKLEAFAGNTNFPDDICLVGLEVSGLN